MSFKVSFDMWQLERAYGWNYFRLRCYFFVCFVGKSKKIPYFCLAFA